MQTVCFVRVCFIMFIWGTAYGGVPMGQPRLTVRVTVFTARVILCPCQVTPLICLFTMFIYCLRQFKAANWPYISNIKCCSTTILVFASHNHYKLGKRMKWPEGQCLSLSWNQVDNISVFIIGENILVVLPFFWNMLLE